MSIKPSSKDCIVSEMHSLQCKLGDMQMLRMKTTGAAYDMHVDNSPSPPPPTPPTPPLQDQVCGAPHGGHIVSLCKPQAHKPGPELCMLLTPHPSPQPLLHIHPTIPVSMHPPTPTPHPTHHTLAGSSTWSTPWLETSGASTPPMTSPTACVTRSRTSHTHCAHSSLRAGAPATTGEVYLGPGLRGDIVAWHCVSYTVCVVLCCAAVCMPLCAHDKLAVLKNVHTHTCIGASFYW
jgi:hypothetical protein